MNSKEIIAPILSLIGGVLILLSILPVISDFLPLSTFSSTGGIRIDYTFWGENVKTAIDKGTTHTVTGWTIFGFSGIIMFLIFAVCGVLGIAAGLNFLMEIESIEEIAGIPFEAILAFFSGIVALIFVFLIWIGDSGDVSKYGFTPSNGGTIGLGFIALLFGSILMIIGGLSNTIINRNH